MKLSWRMRLRPDGQPECVSRCGWLCALVLLAGNLPAQDGRLLLTNAAGGLQLRWSAEPSESLLEQSPTLSPPLWSVIAPQLYRTDGLFRSVPLGTSPTNLFFRLRRPSANGLASRWQLDEGAGSSSGEASALGRLTLENATWGDGWIGPGAMRLNGNVNGTSLAWTSNTQYRVLPPPGQPFSLSLWINPEASTNGRAALVGNDRFGTNGWQLDVASPGPGTNWLIFNAAGVPGSLSVTGRTLLLPGRWRHVIVTHDGAVGSIYLDNVLLAQGTGALANHSGRFLLGGGLFGSASFAGRLDELRTYTNALTASEIALNGAWEFDEPGGTLLSDLSPQGRQTTLVDESLRVSGHRGSGLALGGVTQWLSNDDYGLLPPSGEPFGVSFWIRPDALEQTGERAILSCGALDRGGWELACARPPGGPAEVRWSATRFGGTLELVAPVPFTNGHWTKLDLSFNGGVGTLYADGRKVRTEIGAIRGSREPLRLGDGEGLPKFTGALDSLRVFGRERDEAEIGPVARVTWETVLVNSSSNLVLQGFVPANKPLLYALDPSVTPTNGTVTLRPDSGQVVYQAGARKGPDAFTFTVSDGEFTSVPTLVVVSVVEPHWLAPSGGTAGQDGTSPERAWPAGTAEVVDAIWQTNRYYDAFFYAPGVYPTRGFTWSTRATAFPGCKHIGSSSTGSNASIIRLVDALASWTEGTIFCTKYLYEICDNFEVKHMVLDCNAEQVPKWVRGEPAWIRVPLAQTGLVDTVTLRWGRGNYSFLGYGQIGPASDYRLVARLGGVDQFVTNRTGLTASRVSDTIKVQTQADELYLEMTRRAPLTHFYGLSQIDVLGNAPSLPTATRAGGGESRLDVSHPIVAAFDDDASTAWASGPESQVEIQIPLQPGSFVNQLRLQWTCHALDAQHRLGPAVRFRVRARDETNGVFADVPLVRQPLGPDSWETCVFGTETAPTYLRTDRLVLVLEERDAAASYYGLREIVPMIYGDRSPLRGPSASSRYVNGSVLNAFDNVDSTEWTSTTAGMVAGINVTGSNLKFSDLKIRGFGTRAGKECFPLLVHSAGIDAVPRRMGNIVVEDCELSQPARNNTDGISCIVMTAVSPDTFSNAVVRRCVVSGLRPDFYYSSAITAEWVEHSRVENTGYAIYFEPDMAGVDHTAAVLVRSNQFLDVNFGLRMLFHPGAQSTAVVCEDNEVSLAGGWGFAGCDVCDPGPNASMTNFVLLRNVVHYNDWNRRPLSVLDGGMSYWDIHHAVYVNNVIALGTTNDLRVRQCPSGSYPPLPPFDECVGSPPLPPNNPPYPPCVDVLRPGYRRAWLNNRDLTGALLPVRFYSFGLDGLATDQQWAE